MLLERGARVVPYTVDEDGPCVDALPSGPAALVRLYCTPSHQYRLGGRLSLPRRQTLLRWAEQEDVLIVEDDCDSEFRYDVAPLSALASLDQAGTVAYLGTFSKSLSPALRVGYVIGSSALIERLVDHRLLFKPSTRFTGARLDVKDSCWATARSIPGMSNGARISSPR